jgi:uncharacterized metal-binding protein
MKALQIVVGVAIGYFLGTFLMSDDFDLTDLLDRLPEVEMWSDR